VVVRCGSLAVLVSDLGLVLICVACLVFSSGVENSKNAVRTADYLLFAHLKCLM